MNADNSNFLPTAPPEWFGDLDDDCTCNWGGLMLRAEWMQDDLWWWDVYDPQLKRPVATTLDQNEKPCHCGADARLGAENAALAYLKYW